MSLILDDFESTRCTSSVALTPLAYQFSVITVLELEKPDKLSKIINPCNCGTTVKILKESLTFKQNLKSQTLIDQIDPHSSRIHLKQWSYLELD